MCKIHELGYSPSEAHVAVSFMLSTLKEGIGLRVA